MSIQPEPNDELPLDADGEDLSEALVINKECRGCNFKGTDMAIRMHKPFCPAWKKRVLRLF